MTSIHIVYISDDLIDDYSRTSTGTRQTNKREQKKRVDI